MKPQIGKCKLKPSGIDWIGDVPEGWGVRRIKYLVGGEGTVFMDGDWINSDIIVDDGVRYLTSGNVGVGVFKRQGNGHITDETFKELNCLKALPGDLMLCRLNEPLGRGCIIPDDEPYYVIAVDNVILRPEKDYDKRYIMHCVSCDRFSTAALIAASGATMQRISRNDLGRLSIPVPPLDEQKRIAAKLDRLCGRVDELVANLTKEIAALQDYRKSLITECVTKGLNPKNKMKPSGVDWIGDMPEGWVVRRIKYLVGDEDTLFSDGDWINNDIIVDDGVRYLTSGNVGVGVFKRQGNGYITDETFKELNCLKALPGDLMLCRLNEPLGRGCIIPDDEPYYVIAVDNVILRPEKNYDKRYIMYCVSCDRFSTAALIAASGATMQRISRSDLGRLSIPIPPFDEQCRIAALLDEKCAVLDAKIAERKGQLEKLAEYRSSVIYEYVTGKKEIAA